MSKKKFGPLNIKVNNYFYFNFKYFNYNDSIQLILFDTTVGV